MGGMKNRERPRRTPGCILILGAFLFVVGALTDSVPLWTLGTALLAVWCGGLVAARVHDEIRYDHWSEAAAVEIVEIGNEVIDRRFWWMRYRRTADGFFPRRWYICWCWFSGRPRPMRTGESASKR